MRKSADNLSLTSLLANLPLLPLPSISELRSVASKSKLWNHFSHSSINALLYKLFHVTGMLRVSKSHYTPGLWKPNKYMAEYKEWWGFTSIRPLLMHKSDFYTLNKVFQTSLLLSTSDFKINNPQKGLLGDFSNSNEPLTWLNWQFISES